MGKARFIQPDFMFFKSDAKIKSRLREVESRVKLGSSSNLQEDLEFLANNYSAMGAWDKAHAVTQHMVSLAEGTADANLSIWEAVDDTLPTKNRDEHQRLIIGLCIIVAAVSLTFVGLSKISPKQVADLRCAVFPNDSQSLCQRARLELRQGDFAAAMADCDQALIAQPQNKDAFHIKADILDWQGDLESANQFNELSDKTQADYWRSKSNIEYVRGQYKDAAFDAHQAGMIDKYYFDFISEEYDWALTGDKDKALAAAFLSETYAKNNVEKANSYRSIARSQVRLKRWDEALTACDIALNLLPDYRTYGLKAESLLAKGDFNGALKAADSAIFNDNSYSKGYEIRASAFEKLGRFSDAASDRRIVDLLGHKPSEWI